MNKACVDAAIQCAPRANMAAGMKILGVTILCTLFVFCSEVVQSVAFNIIALCTEILICGGDN